MVRKIVTVQEPRLRTPAKPVQNFDKKLQNLVRDIADTLEAQHDPEGVGLAATQIGVSLRVFITRLHSKTKVFINPEILNSSTKDNDPNPPAHSGLSPSGLRLRGYHSDSRRSKTGGGEKDDYIMEGCLSLPHYYGPVKRSWEVEIKYQNPKGESITETIKGFPAQIIQHEVDHLNGKIFIDRLFEQNRQLYKLVKNEWQEVELP